MLSFDVLGVIFAYYAETETIIHPLETLLLVCRDWRNAALGHRALWGRLRIYLSHEPASRVWSVRLPLRLARCGSNPPLDIDLRNALAGFNGVDEEDGDIIMDYLVPPEIPCPEIEKCDVLNRYGHKCACRTTVPEFITLSLKMLIGSNGEKCKQWRSLKIDLGHKLAVNQSEYSNLMLQLGSALSFPTPNLISLEFRHVSGQTELAGMNMFPDTPKLKKFTLFKSTLPSLPPCRNLLNVSIVFSDRITQQDGRLSLRDAGKMQVLSLRSIHNGIPLPKTLEHLHTLRLCTFISSTLDGCWMPNVSTLVIDSGDVDLLAQVLASNSLVMERLLHVTLTWDLRYAGSLPPKEELTNTLDSITELLTKAQNIRVIKADWIMTGLILRVLWNSLCITPPQRDTPERMPDRRLFTAGCLINLDRHDSFNLDGGEDHAAFEQLADRWGCTPPNLDLVDL